jgi:hypothetical protein
MHESGRRRSYQRRNRRLETRHPTKKQLRSRFFHPQVPQKFCPQCCNLAVAVLHSLFQRQGTLSSFEIFLRNIFFEFVRLAKL